LTISIKSTNYKKIIHLEKKLTSIDLISNFYILNFNNKFIQYKIIYNGSPKTFFNDMSNNNFDLVMENNVWTVK
jgi:replication initiation and membrane attachment protein DnaB